MTNEDELVAPEAGDHVAPAGHGSQPPRDLDQDLVADVMPITIVDVLKTVEVDEGDRGPGTEVFPCQVGMQRSPVGQTGQRVAVGLTPKFLACSLSFDKQADPSGDPTRELPGEGPDVWEVGMGLQHAETAAA